MTAIDPRNQRYKDKVLNAPYEICTERARYYTESFKQTEGEHPALRAAKAFAHTLENMSLHILDEERIVGNRASRLVAAVIPIERGDINTVLDMELDMITQREQQPFHVEDEQKRELREEILPYWKGKTLRDRKKQLWKEAGLVFLPSLRPDELVSRRRGLNVDKLREFATLPDVSAKYAIRGFQELAYNNPAFVMNVFDVQGHMILGQKNILRDGFVGVHRQARKRLKQARAEGDEEGVVFLDAVIICCEAMRDFALRFADLADAEAKQTDDPARKRELEEIAARCRRVPWHVPRDFREALQALWLTQVGGFVAYGMTGIFAVGRLDQYLYPFYIADKEAERLGDDEAVAWLEEVLIKLSYNLLLLPTIGKKTGSELGSDSCSPTIGGVDEEGNDAVNELSYLLLDAFANIKSMGNSFTVRLSDKNPREFWRKAMSTYRITCGAALFNDEVAVAALKNCGYPDEHARDFGAIGCVEPTGDGNTFGCTSGNDISFIGALEMTLLNGRLRMMGKRVGPRTGDPTTFVDFEQFIDAYEEQIAWQVDTVAEMVNLKDRAYAESFPCPFVSATVTGCVENARDMTQGGAQYNFGSISARGLGTAANALAAIRHLVYDKKMISMSHLITMLDRNFTRDHTLQTLMNARCPKFGNDDDAADDIAKRVCEFFCREVASKQTIRGGPFRPGFFSYGMHVLEGLFLGATPDGRNAGEPVSNSFSPANGSERSGPTAMLRSMAKIDQTLISNGCALNMKLMPKLLSNDERLDKVIALIKGYFAMGGMEVQPNVIDNATLLAAQEHPEQFRDLVVRVSGYSALFTDLGKPLQDEIIARTEFDRL